VAEPGTQASSDIDEGPVRPILPLRQSSPHEGHINSGALVLDNPIVDRITPVLSDKGRLVPSFSLEAARMATGAHEPMQKVEGGWKVGNLHIPTDSDGSFLITFLRPSGYGVRDVVFPTIPYERIVDGGVDEPFFRDHKYFQDKIVLVGDSSKVGNDHSATPIGEIPGVEIHAHAVATILSGAYLHEAPESFNLAAIIIMGSLVCLLAAARRLQTVVMSIVGVGLAFSFLNMWLFVTQGFWMHLIAPLTTLALAAVGMLIEDGLFHESEREKMFEAFVLASASAIESRDPATSGHSKRVTDLCIELAKAVTQTRTGPLRKASFTPAQLKELSYAGLLHDFGKIGVRENVLTKSHKLPPDRFEAVQCRLALAYSQMELQCSQEKLQVLQLTQVLTAQDTARHVKQIEAKYAHKLQQVQLDGKFLHHCNDPMVTFLPDAEYERLQEVLERLEQLAYTNSDGQKAFVITYEERDALSIRKGSLTRDEYKEIQRHSQFSYDFLKQIPWTDSMAQVPSIAYGHHEKLNGTGYPRGLKAADIALPVRIMTIADIFDALTAADRPYKKSMPIERALAILSEEADSGALDSDLLQIFIEQKVYEKVDGSSTTPAIGNQNTSAVSSITQTPETSHPKKPSTPAHRLA
jgi:HD-GYP domain-containing protein (c-di-GMP phosphodiesterase class II)